MGNADEQSVKDNTSSSFTPEGKEEEPDPFGLDALIPSTSKKDDKVKGKRESVIKNSRGEAEEAKQFLRGKREALISCLEIAARRYKTPWSYSSYFYYAFLLFFGILHLNISISCTFRA